MSEIQLTMLFGGGTVAIRVSRGVVQIGVDMRGYSPGPLSSEPQEDPQNHDWSKTIAHRIPEGSKRHRRRKRRRRT
jgi:hypothetical protein